MMKVKLYIGILAGKLFRQNGHHNTGTGGAAADAKAAPLFFFDIGKHVFQIILADAHLIGMSEKHFSGVGQGQTGPALKQFHTVMLFKTGNLTAQVLLRYKQAFGSLGEIQIFCGFREVNQTV